MSESATVNQFIVRLGNFVDENLIANVSMKFIADQARIAWDNGWRDHTNIGKIAIAGTKMHTVDNPAALFASQLRTVCALPTTEERTSQPPSISEVRAAMNQGHQPSKNPNAHISECRKAIEGDR